MADPISELVFGAVISRLQNILIAGDYYTDAGASVHRARRSFVPAEMPAISVWDAGESPTKGGQGGYSMTIEQLIDVEVYALAEQDDTGVIVGRLKADVKRAVLASDTLAGLVTSTGQRLGAIAYRGARALTREDGGETEGAVLSFAVYYQEGYGDPTSSSL